jgi:polar amino acid transport system substrate-binding protein
LNLKQNLFLLLALYWGGRAQPVLAGDAPLRVPHIADAPPFMLTDAQQIPNGGILFDIYQQISAAMQRPLQIEAIPRKRVTDMLLRGQLDFYCNGTPDWFTEPQLRWSPPLFVHRDLYVSVEPYRDFADFKQRVRGKVGTTFGYVYPTLTELFARGQLQRVDSYSPAESLRHLQRHHLNAVVVSEFEFGYLLAQKQDLHVVEIERNQIRCMYSPVLSEQTIEQLNQTITRLGQQGKIEQILAAYR